jgi:hypothetical protein
MLNKFPPNAELMSMHNVMYMKLQESRQMDDQS